MLQGELVGDALEVHGEFGGAQETFDVQRLI
jgi:hypothetical protein